MKVLVFNNTVNERGGAERVMLKIAQHYNSTIYTQQYDPEGTFPEFRDLDVHVIGHAGHNKSKPNKAINAVKYGMSFYNMRVKEDYDVLNAHMSPSEWIRNRNERVLWYCHTPPRIVYDRSVSGIKKRSIASRAAYLPLSIVYKGIEHSIAKRMEGIAANSRNTQERIKTYLGVPSAVINPCVDASDFNDAGDDRFFLYPSRIAEEKRQEYAIMAFRRFMEASGRKDYRLVIAGSLSKRHAEFGRYFERIRKNAGRGVEFRTNPDDSELKDLYSRCTAVLYPPINEDFGIVPLEAMASSKPVIAVNEGGPKETVQDKKTGFLVGSPEAMAERMLYLARNEPMAVAMGRAGRRLVEKKYTWASFFKRFDRMARKVARA